MDFGVQHLAAIALLLDEEEDKKKRYWVHPMWVLREAEGEFMTLYRGLVDHETKFYEYFRMSQNAFNDLLKKVEKLIQKKDTFWRRAISPRERLAVCLRYLATGDSFKTISFSYRLGHSTVHSIVTETCDAIVKALIKEVMPEPSEEEWKRIAQEFMDIWNFPNCIGAVDGKHVCIQAPPNSGSQFFNYKKFFSVVLLALFDANYNFIAVDVGAYGKNSDGGVWAHSNIGKAFELGFFSIPGTSHLPGTNIELPQVIVADEAFPLKSYIMRPYPRQELDDQKRIFNYRLSRARRVSENGFGILCQKFRIYNRRIQSLPGNVDNIILATCVLHNFIRRYGGPSVSGGDESSNENNQANSRIRNLPLRGGNATRQAFEIRDSFKEYFCSEAGSVPWQNALNRIPDE